jgi:hypothetical protein
VRGRTAAPTRSSTEPKAVGRCPSAPSKILRY